MGHRQEWMCTGCHLGKAFRMNRERRCMGQVGGVAIGWRRELALVLLSAVLFLPACRASAPALSAAGTATLEATSAPARTPSGVVVSPTTNLPEAQATPALTTTVTVHVPMASKAPGVPTYYTYRVIHTYPHDPGAFTQGLVFEDGILFEGTGLYGGSTLRKVALETGQVLQRYNLPQQYFGEGIAVVGDRLIQLTWQNHEGFVYRKETFEPLQTFSYPTEGWGLAYDGVRLIMSDGTATLHFLDPQSLVETGHVEVRDGGTPVVRLNELEYIDGQVWANVWQTDRIVRIDPQTGAVVGWIDLAGLLKPGDRTGAEDVLNGIAYDAQGARLFVTGKWWPKMFEIELVPIRSRELRRVVPVPAG
jgi:glutamine cyclotransferase